MVVLNIAINLSETMSQGQIEGYLVKTINMFDFTVLYMWLLMWWSECLNVWWFDFAPKDKVGIVYNNGPSSDSL